LIAGECRAARGVAGDYYDYIEIARTHRSGAR
jgi:transcriptional antiterminator Rof (Rho-off)